MGTANTSRQDSSKRDSIDEMAKSRVMTDNSDSEGAINSKNFVNEVNGSKGYEAIVKIGESSVRVRSVVNSPGNLRTVYPLKPK